MQHMTRGQWGFSGPLGPSMTVPARGAYLHHSVTNPTSSPAADMRTLERIGKNRFGRLSYSWAIHPNGAIMQGQDVHIGAHTAKQNSTSFGIVLIGNYDAHPVPDAMIRSTAILLNYLFDTGRAAQLELIGGHRDSPHSSTACPGRHGYNAMTTINVLAHNLRQDPWETFMSNLTTQQKEVLTTLSNLTPKQAEEVAGFAREVVLRKTAGASIVRQVIGYTRGGNKDFIDEVRSHIAAKNSSTQGLIRGSINLFRAARDDYKVDTR